LRSDQQLIALFRAGYDEAFRVIHDRYRPRLQAYVRQMLAGHSSDVEDALQDVFVRAYAGLRANDRELALRPWLYRVAHNRCVDELRRCSPQSSPELVEACAGRPDSDPVAESERRETLQRLVTDIERLPDQQRSALLMHELSGMPYADVADVLGVSVPAVKSLLMRARTGLHQAREARSVACAEIRQQLLEAHGRGVRPSWMARRHMRDCASCREWRVELRGWGRRVAVFAPFGFLAKLFGGGAGGGTAAGAGGAFGASVGGGVASGAAGLTVSHVAAVVAAAVVTTGGALELQHTVSAPRAPQHAQPAAEESTPATPASTEVAAPRASSRASAKAPTSTHSTGVRAKAVHSTEYGASAIAVVQPATSGGATTTSTTTTPAQTAAPQTNQQTPTTTDNLLCHAGVVLPNSSCTSTPGTTNGGTSGPPTTSGGTTQTQPGHRTPSPPPTGGAPGSPS
jgi:RNA polymerase sigma factor (sigma-70 family)